MTLCAVHAIDGPIWCTCFVWNLITYIIKITAYVALSLIFAKKVGFAMTKKFL